MAGRSISHAIPVRWHGAIECSIRQKISATTPRWRFRLNCSRERRRSDAGMRQDVSRRNLLKKGAAAGGLALAPQGLAQAQRKGKKFRAFVRHGTTASVEELTMLPIQSGEVVVRTQASAVCYTIVAGVLG